MKKLSVLLLIGMLSAGVAGCAGTAKTGSQEAAVERTPPVEIEGDAGKEAPMEKRDGIDPLWQQCLDMEENASMEKYPSVTASGAWVTPGWTVKDFLESGLADNALSIEMKAVQEKEDGSHEYSTVAATKEDLLEGMHGIDVFIVTESVTASFSLPSTTFETETGLVAQDLPISTLSVKDGFTCKGLTPGSSKTDVAKVFGPTHWGGESMDYKCGTFGYVSFTFGDGGLDEIYMSFSE